MAFPTTLTTQSPASTHFQCGGFRPFISSAGNVYIVARDPVTTQDYDILKATDPTSSFSVAANMSGPASARNIAVAQDGDKLHIVVTDSANIYYGRFDMSDDGVEATFADTGANMGLSAYDATIHIQADGDIVIYFNGSNTSSKGTSYGQIYETNSSDSGSTWSTPARLSVGDTTHHRYIGGIVGSSDTYHLFYTDTENFSEAGNLMTLAVSSAHSAQTERDTGANTAALTNLANPAVSFTRSSTAKVRFAYPESTSAGNIAILEFDAAADPSTFNASSVINTSIAESTTFPSIWDVAVDGSAMYCVWIDDGDLDLMYDNDTDSDTWGTDQDAVSSISATSVFCNIYTRSGSKVLALVYNNGGTWQYNEVTLTAAPPPETHGGTHHIECGIGDVGDGPRLPQTLHVIEHGITL